MKVSLVIPAHNEEKEIGECLRHVARSDHAFHEIIVVDNASTDRTPEIAREYGVMVVSEPRKGVQKARQAGASRATGDIIAFVDADNRMPPGWYGKVVREFEKDPSLVCLSGPYHYIGISKIDAFWIRVYWTLAAMPSYVLTGYMAVLGNMAIRRDVLEKMGGLDTSIDFYGDDTNTARRAKKHGKVKFKYTFVMHASARRLHAQGTWKTAAVYAINYLSEVIRKRPFHTTHRDIR